MKRRTLLGFIQLPILIAVTLILSLGSLAAYKIPQIKQENSFKKLAKNNLPTGTAKEKELLVGLQPNLDLPQIAKIHQAQNVSHKKTISQIQVDVVTIPDRASLPEIQENYLKQEGVDFAEPNFLAQAFLTPNDPLYSKQWGLEKIDSPEAFERAQEGEQTIAIIDTGVDKNHPELSHLLLSGYNTVEENENTEDDHGHGTHVAGITAAQTNNELGVASSSFSAQILPVKVLNQDGIGTYADVAEGITYAADKGSRLLNLSLGGNSDSQTLKRAVKYAQEKGSLLIAAAGNNGNDTPVYPAAYEGVLAVSATDQDDNLANFSSFGENIFVAAPGVSITSTELDDSYKSKDGTSMSAPHLSGVLALSLAKEELSNSELIELIKETADKVGSEDYNKDGWNSYFGYGRLNAGKALTELASEEEKEEEEKKEEEQKEDEKEEAPPTIATTPSAETPETFPQKQEKVPEKYSFNFELQGKVESRDQDETLTIKMEGGTPEILNLVSGDLVTIYTNSNTQIRYQNKETELENI
ncbi:MAG: S8 family peptidase, partial [Patescibacteria group bacterium]